MNGNVRDREYIGQGLAFPLQIDPQGGIALAKGPREIEQAIRIVLGTAPGERRMRPEFGCRIHELVFAPRNAATERLVVYYVQEALERWEPRIELRDVAIAAAPEQDVAFVKASGQELAFATAPGQDGALLIEIRYQVKDTHDERSIVYPFYLAGEEEVF